jgi:hypothetical protein
LVDIAVAEKTWAYARVDGKEAAIVVMNNGDEAVDVRVPFADGRYVGQLGGGDLTVSEGTGTVRVAGHSAEVYLSH